ncbi:NAD-dependent epimerase/dehydratase family protein [Thermodesulfobacteriota bacterium]
MKVLVTGARGFLGRYVVDQLVQNRINTVAVGRYLPENISSTDFIQLDLIGQVNFQELVDRAEATHLLHLAWYAEHGKFWTSPLNLRWTEATVRLTEAFCLAGGKKVVTAGTCAEYDWSYGYCREDNTPLNPSTLYGTAKDAARRLTIAVCAQHHVPCAWGRIFLPYGQGEDSRRLIPSLMEVFQGKRPAFGVNATAYRDFLHAEDLAQAFVRLLQSEAEGAYNLCSGQPTQIAEIVRLIASSFNAEAENVLNLSAERPGEPTLLVGDNHKLKALGWQQNNSLASILGVV